MNKHLKIANTATNCHINPYYVVYNNEIGTWDAQDTVHSVCFLNKKEEKYYFQELRNIFKKDAFNPFDFYYSKVPGIIVSYIIGQTYGEPMPIHLLFASLDNISQILAFCRHFGVPAYGFCDKECDTDNPDRTHWNGKSNIDFVIYDIKSMQLAIKILNIKKVISADHPLLNINKDIWGIDEDFHDALISKAKKRIKLWEKFMETFSITEDIHFFLNSLDFSYVEDEEQEKERIILFGTIGLNDILGIIFNTYLSKVSPGIDFRKKSHDFEWNFPNLVSAFFLMLSLDIAADSFPQICANPLCSKYFTPDKRGTLYCSDACQNRAKQQRHRAKIKENKKTARA